MPALEINPDQPIANTVDIDRGSLLCLCRLAAIPVSAHPEIDRRFASIGRPLPSEQAESRYLSMGDLETAIYARRCYMLAENNSFTMSVLIDGWPNLIRYLDSRKSHIDINDFVNYLSRKADPENPTSDNSFAEHIFLLGHVCKLLHIELDESDAREIEKISHLVTEIPVNLDQGPFLSIDKEAMREAMASVGLNYPLCRHDAPRTKLMKVLLASEKSLPEEITGIGKLEQSDVLDTMQCLYDSAVLHHVNDTFHFEKEPSGKPLTAKEYFKAHSWLTNQLIELSLVLKWSIRSQRQSLDDAIHQIEEYAHHETSESPDEKAIIGQYEQVCEKLAQAESEIRDNQKRIQELEETCANHENNLSELHAYREMFFAMAQEKSDQSWEEDNSEAWLQKNIAAVNDRPFAFVGGHVNLVQKLKRIFPQATFISERGFDPAILKGPDTIFIYADSLSHATYYKVINNAGRNKIRFLSGEVNVEKIIAKMASAISPVGERE